MVALIQRVKSASVSVSGQSVGSIGPGMLILLGIHSADSEIELAWLAKKCASIRIFADENGKMNRSVIESSGEILVVSQFTLYGSVQNGNRPSFEQSATADIAKPLYNSFVARISSLIEHPVQTGKFGEMMDVELVNDGPVTLWVERKSDG